MKITTPPEVEEKCFHCGDPCKAEATVFQEKYFCCHGCKSVFELLQSCDLDDYYKYAENPGIKTLKAPPKEAFAYLDDAGIQEKLLSFRSDSLAKVNLRLPAIHCASCIWLIENFRKLIPGVLESRVNFVKRTAYFSYDPSLLSLRHLVEQLAAIGYEPDLKLSNTTEKKINTPGKIVLQIGVAGFCFGNIMLLSFPEYLSIGADLSDEYRSFFGYLNFLLSLPVLFFSARDYFSSAIGAVNRRRINMDVPIAVGMLAIFIRSSYEIFIEGGGGYMDSLSALVFFLLIGKWFQQKTYDSLSFERDYKSYFPIAVQRLENGIEKPCGIEKLKPGDHFRVRSGELIPVDAFLVEGECAIDYSFVSGESEPVKIEPGNRVFAGGRQTASAIVLEALKSVDQSYLTGLWNSDGKGEEEHQLEAFADRVGRSFTYVVLGIAVVTCISWLLIDPSVALNAVSAVLIVACPCALALSFPFAFGNAVRLLGREGFYLKNGLSLGKMAEVTHIVFDKTGTLTRGSEAEVEFDATLLGESELQAVFSMASQSGHPLSRAIARELETKDVELLRFDSFEEKTGEGIQAFLNGIEYRLGSAKFTGVKSSKVVTRSDVYFTIDGILKVKFSVKKQYRYGLEGLISKLKKRYSLFLLSGDNDADRETMEGVFSQKHGLFFNKLPHEKRDFLKNLKRDGAITAMVGDGLNDGAALKESHFGISVSDDVFRFAPASDAILASEGFHKLDGFFNYSAKALKVVRYSLILSFLYNAVGLFFAVQGLLTPVIAAILMPLSSITVVGFVSLCTSWYYRKYFKTQPSEKLIKVSFVYDEHHKNSQRSALHL